MKEKTARQAALLRAIEGREINTQEELVQELAKAGFAVTQATLSRDLKELGVSKTRSASGEPVYSKGGAAPSPAWPVLKRMTDSLVSEIKLSGNIVVIKTAAGHASGVASAVDGLGEPSVLGSVAGDDTIIVVTSDEDKGREFADRLLKKGA